MEPTAPQAPVTTGSITGPGVVSPDLGALTPALSPTERIPPDLALEVPERGTALCLSGGGYRAALFHLGTLWRLNEAGWLKRLDRVSSVSGGSITAGALALAWDRLGFDDRGVGVRFEELVAAPLHRLCSHTVDLGAVLRGVLLPGTVGDRVEWAYRKHVFGAATLQDLPRWPMFVINASNVQTGALWRFTRYYMADYRVGKIDAPATPIAKAVAASSAFPPVLSPVRLELEESDYEPLPPPGPGVWVPDLRQGRYMTDVVLTDGGVYDNLGLETAWKKYSRVLVSDAGGGLEPEESPKSNWPQHSYRVLNLIDGQVRALRKRQVNGSFALGTRLREAGADMDDRLIRYVTREGAYWSIRGTLEGYGEGEALPFPPAESETLAGIPTRLKKLDERTRQGLVNWGYAACDARMRRYVDKKLPQGRYPYPAG